MHPRMLPSASALAGTGSLLCLLFTVATLSLGLTAYDLTGTFNIFDDAAPARFETIRGVWGLFLASQIVRTVLATAFFATVWWAGLVRLLLGERPRAAVNEAVRQTNSGFSNRTRSPAYCPRQPDSPGPKRGSNMKLAKIIAAAGLTVAAVTMSTSADAQNYRHRGHDRHSSWDRGHHNGWNNGRHNGWNRHQRDCRVVWRHHHRVRVCYR